ncbi:Large ribosomal subunit protein bL21 [Candidatus Xenohaliotis californiensis]|uniref:Large ribosomal subunit protein bL21 n=1 Tax=Candidatus Xenohaliotis californiensis TaxID=84677 RepID=A0ABP0ETB0_9RICK|nr:Large ribosomal subunit protein bL21 [Candidatus Xenohaliotis californiensis]
MFAVIGTGGKQYVVKQNTIIKTEKILGNVGDIIKIKEPLMISDDANKLSFKKGSVNLCILEQKKDKKIYVFKKKRRKNYRRKHGHRQFVTILKVADINL